MRSRKRHSLRVLAIAIPLWVSATPAVCASACADHDASANLATSTHPHASDHATHRAAPPIPRGMHRASGLHDAFGEALPASPGEPRHGVQTCRDDARDLLGSRPEQASAAPQLAAAVVPALPVKSGWAGRTARGDASLAQAFCANTNAPLRC